jgi:hypothetical protein
VLYLPFFQKKKSIRSNARRWFFGSKKKKINLGRSLLGKDLAISGAVTDK